ncbi:AfsR/SARP family transcriptional regulator [Longispora fulva]|uniref:DNA-binding SARP family transcriptional activator/tetratricopeptide (TPR) repeat protein n=1 Tax=Longispora fulva TaxID=619741 RepID=A0A8J7KUY2_9ACTN|nr:BTAD domain-containing putative transcriptional regulator [Longispora fulva]MBG6134597.1 DNA-binding SARP family transcriptional activator/tetratricopeptide (TPR) repeat protein [Longispora fulva]
MVWFGALGPLLVRTDDADIDVPGGTMATILAVLLFNACRTVSADRLAALTWQDRSPADMRATLHVQVSRLRRRLGPVAGARVRTRPGGYLIEADPDEFDLLQFTALVGDGRSALAEQRWPQADAKLRAALALWRDTPLLDVPPGPLHRDELPRVTELHLQARECLIEAGLHLGREHAVVADATALRAEHPLREAPLRLAMLALYRCGRPADALAAYRAGRATLRAELGIDPGEAVSRLHQRILAADPTLLASGPRPPVAGGPTRPLPGQLPADLADFTGRTAQVEALRALCQPDPGRAGMVVLSAVAGAGGIGKSSLAVHVAHALRPLFPDGQLYANLRGTGPDPVPPAEVLDRFLRDLGAAPAAPTDDEDARAATFRSMLADRRMLILLDDALDSAQVRTLLPGTPSCTVLITSRNRLAGLDGASRVDLDVLPAADAHALFTRIVGAAAVAAEPEATEEVLRACAGLPLAIRIAAARLIAEPGWKVRALADRLSDRARLLDELRLEDRAVRASLEVGHQRLPAEEARAFALLGRWTGPDLGLAAAAVLLDRGVAETATLVRGLLDVHLLHEPQPGRYAFHDLVRVFAVERAVADAAGAVRRLTTWHLHGIAAADVYLRYRELRLDLPALDPRHPAPTFADKAAAVTWLDAEHANLVAGVGCAAGHRVLDVAWQTPVALTNYFNFRARWADWSRTGAIGLVAARELRDEYAESRTLTGLGVCQHRRRQLARSADSLRRAALLAGAIGEPHSEVAALSHLGYTYTELGDLDLARVALLRAAELSAATGDRYSEANAMSNLARADLLLGDHATAATRVRRAAALFHELGNQHSYSRAMNNLGEIQLRSGDQPAAVDSFREALRLHRETGNRHLEAQTLVNLGDAVCLHGQTPEGVDLWRQALTVMESCDDPYTGELRAALDGLTPDTRRVSSDR